MCHDVQSAQLQVRSYAVQVRASLAQRAFYTGSTAWLGAVFEKFQSSFSLAFPWFRSAHTCHRIVATIAWASPLDPRLSVLQGMNSAVFNVSPCTLCSSSRKAAVATYSRAISGLRLALGSPLTLSGSVRRSHCYRAFLTRCDSTAAAAPAKATSQQVCLYSSAWLHRPVLSAHEAAHTFL